MRTRQKRSWFLNDNYSRTAHTPIHHSQPYGSQNHCFGQYALIKSRKSHNMGIDRRRNLIRISSGLRVAQNKPFQTVFLINLSPGAEAKLVEACKKVSGWLATATHSMRKTTFCNPVTKSRGTWVWRHPRLKKPQSQRPGQGTKSTNEWRVKLTIE